MFDFQGAQDGPEGRQVATLTSWELHTAAYNRPAPPGQRSDAGPLGTDLSNAPGARRRRIDAGNDANQIEDGVS